MTIRGRHTEAIAAAQHAARIDPLSSGTQFNYGAVLYFARKYEDALAPLKRAIELEPRNDGAIIMLGVVYEGLGRTQEALALFDRPGYRESPYIATAYALLGRRDNTLKVLNKVVKRGGAFDLQEMAVAYFALGDRDRGFEWLTKAFDQRQAFVSWAKVNPVFDAVRDDSRFKDLVARLKLPD